MPRMEKTSSPAKVPSARRSVDESGVDWTKDWEPWPFSVVAGAWGWNSK